MDEIALLAHYTHGAKSHPMNIPTLTTERLVLRAPCADDFDGYAQFYADAEASGAYGCLGA